MVMLKKFKSRVDQKGFASIVVALVMIVVFGLLTIGFTQLARHEQQNSLSKQLANQAYYAAESGINATIKNLSTIATHPPATGQCISPSDFPSVPPSFPANNYVDPSLDVKFTCVLLD